MKKFLVGLVSIVCVVILGVSLAACGSNKIEGKFVFDSVEVTGLDDYIKALEDFRDETISDLNKYLTDLLKETMDEEGVDFYIDFKADGKVDIGSGEEVETFDFEIKNGTITLKKDGVAFDPLADIVDFNDMLEETFGVTLEDLGISFSFAIKYNKNKLSVEASVSIDFDVMLGTLAEVLEIDLEAMLEEMEIDVEIPQKLDVTLKMFFVKA